MAISNLSLSNFNLEPINFSYINENRNWVEDLVDNANPLEDCQSLTEGIIDIKCFENSLNMLIPPTNSFGESEYSEYTDYPEKVCGVCLGDFGQCVDEFLGKSISKDVSSSYWITAPHSDLGCEKKFNVIPLKDGLFSDDTKFCEERFRTYSGFNCDGLSIIFNNQLDSHYFNGDEYILELPKDFTSTPISDLTCHDFPCGDCPDNSISIFWMNGETQVCSWLGCDSCGDGVWMDRIYGTNSSEYGNLGSVLYEDLESSLILESGGLYVIRKPSYTPSSEISSGVIQNSLIFGVGCVESGVVVDSSGNDIEANFRT